MDKSVISQYVHRLGGGWIAFSRNSTFDGTRTSAGRPNYAYNVLPTELSCSSPLYVLLCKWLVNFFISNWLLLTKLFSINAGPYNLPPSILNDEQVFQRCTHTLAHINFNICLYRDWLGLVCFLLEMYVSFFTSLIVIIVLYYKLCTLHRIDITRSKRYNF